ncbi:MAG: hypothetical protein PHN88_09300 [Ignavibacteria bacterium]|nr:hypothetical protein [Ignavibacteria bacterium]
MKTRINILITAAIIFLMIPQTHSQTVITLSRTFIDSIKDRITLTLDYKIDYANDKNISVFTNNNFGRVRASSYNKRSNDLIMRGSSDFIGLPITAKISDAKEYPEAVDLISKHIGDRVKISSVWRIWNNYFGNDTFQWNKSGGKDKRAGIENVFELSPVTQIDDLNITGYDNISNSVQFMDAETAFGLFSQTKCEIDIEDTAITISTRGLSSNYVEFTIRESGLSETVNDGRIAECNVYNNDDILIHKNLRAIFVKDSEPEKIFRNLRKGEMLRVIGIPRISLHEIDSKMRITGANNIKFDGLPVEMIIISVLNK